MHEVCALIFYALNQEATAWSTATPSSMWSKSGVSTPSSWADYMIERVITKKSNILTEIEHLGECSETTLLRHELQFLCEESEVYSIFDHVMTRGLRVVYCPEVTDGVSSSEGESNGENLGIGYLNMIQG